MAVVVGKELAQALVVLGVRARKHAHESVSAGLIERRLECRADESGEHGLQPRRAGPRARLSAPPCDGVQLVEPTPKDFFDEIVLRPEMVIDGCEIDVRGSGDLTQRGAGKTVSREQCLGRAENAVLGREVRSIHAVSAVDLRNRAGGINQTSV